MITFNPDEIFQMAEVIEENGFNFYSKAASLFPNHSQIFSALAQQEKANLEVFKKMRAEIPNTEKEPTAYDPENQSVLFLNG